MAKHQNASNDEITRFEEKVLEGSNFFIDYSYFMEDLFQKGYTERLSNEEEDNCWYIPHHDVCHPTKPGKIRVIFNYSVEYFAYALNKQLIPRSDLTNPII